MLRAYSIYNIKRLTALKAIFFYAYFRQQHWVVLLYCPTNVWEGDHP